VYGHLGSSTELHKLIIFICFKLLKKILVSLFEEMAKKLKILFRNNDFFHDASVYITICLNYFFPSMCDTRLTSYTISLLINDEFCSDEELNVLSYFFLQDFYPCLSVKFVTDGHTVGWKWFNGCGDVVSRIFFMAVIILITSSWVLVAMITTFR